VPKIVLFSDLHAHGFKHYSSINSQGHNTRLVDAVNCVKQVISHAIDIKADLVLFGGDLFHVRKNISVEAFNLVYDAFLDLKKKSDIPLFMIHGNHDQVDRLGKDHSIYSFKSLAVVANDRDVYPIKGASGKAYEIAAIPYTDDLSQVEEIVGKKRSKKATNIFLGHLGIQGAKIGSDFVYSNPNDPTTGNLKPNSYDALFLGHFHLHQELASNAWYIGAPLHHNWGDVGDSRGFLVYDTDARTVERKYLNAPKFVVLTDQETVNRVEEDNYVKVLTNSVYDRDVLQNQLKCRFLEFQSLEKQVIASRVRLAVDPTQSVGDLLKSYVESGMLNSDGLDENYLLSLGADILNDL